MARPSCRSTFPLWALVSAISIVSVSIVGCNSDSSTDTSAAGSTGGNTSTATSAEATEYVAAINAVRAAVTQPSGYTGTWTALPNVTWSDTVAASAQAWANHLATNNNCGLAHEDQNSYGENLAAGSGLSPTAAVQMWASEADLYTWSETYTMADFNEGSGHFTQLVWRESVQIGCASASCGNSVVISCRFSPPGNMMGSSVY